MLKTSLALGLATAIAATSAVATAAAVDHDAHHAAPAAAGSASSAPLSTGEVRKVDTDAKKITIRHGPIENLGMPPMTMVFQVSDPALLTQVKPGDKIRFTAENSGGSYTVTRIEPQ
jgi:Cu(I)/Ag(I) efflux system periplasmic protein CusF